MTVVQKLCEYPANGMFLLQCWENCELLQSNFQVWGAMCEEKEICVSIKYEYFLHDESR